MSIQIEKKTEVILRANDGMPIKQGATCLFFALGKIMCGKFQEITNRGALVFSDPLDNYDVTFNVSYKSIEWIYIIKL